MGDNENISTLPDNVDKILFAEDFVNYILGRFDLPLLPSELAQRPSSVINYFSPITGAAEYYLQLLNDKVMEEFTDISEQKSIDSNAFLKYASSLTCKLMEKNDKTHSDFVRLLKFCVQISTMAARFYESGILNAPDLAVEYIKNVFVGIDMVEEGGFWESLNGKTLESPHPFVEDAVYIPFQESEIVLLSYLSMQGNSDDSSSPNLELNGKDDPDKEIQMNPEKLMKDNSCHMCIAAENASAKEPGSSISVCSHVEKTIDVSTENADSDRTTEHHLLSESPKVETSKYSTHSLEETSSKDNSSNSAGQENEENSSAASNEINCKDDQVEQEIGMNPENVIEGVACQMCIGALETSPEEPGPSIYLCNHVENMIEVRTENTDSDHTTDYSSSDYSSSYYSPTERAHKWDGISSHSSDDETTEHESSSEDDTSKQKRNSSPPKTLYLPRI